VPVDFPFRASSHSFFRLRRTRIRDMAANPRFNGEGEGERLPAGSPADGGGALPPHGVAEVLDLLPERFGTVTVEFDPLDQPRETFFRERRGKFASQRRNPPPKTEELARAVGQVERKVPARLEDADLPHPFHRYPRGGQIRH